MIQKYATRLAVTALALSLSTVLAFADNHEARIELKFTEIKLLLVTDEVIDKLIKINSQRAQISQDQIDELEVQWQSELDSQKYVLISEVVDNSVSDDLRDAAEKANDLISEINLMDANGLSISQTSPNSDIWQGDESKYQNTFLVGPEAVFIDEVEFDNSTQTYQSQLNFTVVDPKTGASMFEKCPNKFHEDDG